MRVLLALVRKDLALFRADRRALILTLLAPAIFAMFFGLAFRKKASDLHIDGRLVAEDQSPAGQRLATALRAVPSLTLTPATRAEAQDLVERGTVHVAIVIPASFTADLAAAAAGKGARPSLDILVDPAARAESQVVEGVTSGLLPRVLADELGEAARRCAENGLPYEVTVKPVSPSGDAGFDGAAHALAGMAVQFLLIGALDMAVNMLGERQKGLFRRIRAAPVSKATLLGSRLLSGAIITAIGLGTLYAFGRFALGVKITGSVPGFVLVALGFCATASAFGLLMSTVGKTPQGARGAGVLVVLLATALSGAWLPSFLFPRWLQDATLAVPTRWAVDGLDAMTWRGLDLGSALAPAAVLFGTALVLAALALWRFKWEE